MTEISKDKVVQKLAEMFEEEWYTNKSEYQDDDGNETKEFKELQEIETVVNKMIIKYYDWRTVLETRDKSLENYE